MKLKTILTDRHYQNWPSWHIVYEWEDELSDSLKLPLKNSPDGRRNLFCRMLKIVDNKIFKGQLNYMISSWRNRASDYFIYFEMCTKNYKSFSNSPRAVPIIIDFWDKNKIKHFKKFYADCPYLLITNLEVLEFLKENHVKNKLIHFPMSLPSIYKLNPTRLFDKKIDILLAGRKNAVLWDYLKRFEVKNPEIEYLHQVQKDGVLYYESNKRGIVGQYHSRSEYMDLIKSAKVAFYSTPGIDGGEIRTGGFNPVTPRFFELLSGGCQLIARYPKTVETDYYELDKICSSVTTYTDFESQLKKALHSAPPITKYAEYLNNFYTSTNIEILKSMI